MHVQLSTEDQSHTTPQGDAPVALGIRYTPVVGHRLSLSSSPNTSRLHNCA